MRGLRNILFKDRLEEAVGVIASLSVGSLMPGENFLLLTILNPNMAQNDIVKALSLLYFYLPAPTHPFFLAVIIFISR